MIKAKDVEVQTKESFESNLNEEDKVRFDNLIEKIEKELSTPWEYDEYKRSFLFNPFSKYADHVLDILHENGWHTYIRSLYFGSDIFYLDVGKPGYKFAWKPICDDLLAIQPVPEDRIGILDRVIFLIKRIFRGRDK